MPAVYNDLEGLRRIFEREGEHIAAVLIEPILGNAQGILPQPGFLEGVRAMTREFGALLIFDEVKTGFRAAKGGAAELVCELTFCDMARLTVSGTEATMHAIRVARGFTGRDRIIKFEGQYHGVHDYALISVLPADVSELGDRSEPVRLAWGRGIPAAIQETVVPAVYNDLEGLRRIFEREGEHIAAVLIEPILGNAQGILPRAGFLQGGGPCDVGA